MTNANTTARQAGLLPCPFCGHEEIDPAEWMTTDGITGPACPKCGGMADSVEIWNSRAAHSADARNGEEVAQLKEIARSLDGWVIHYGSTSPLGKTLREHAETIRALLATPAAPAPWKCGAYAHGDLGGHGPMDCNWPECGCDPHVERVIAGLQECGWTIAKDAAALVAQKDSLEAFKTWVTTVWRPDDGAELLKREFPRFAFAAWQAARQQSTTPAASVRCQCCGYLVTESEHRGCLRAATPAEAASEADQRDAERYRWLRAINGAAFVGFNDKPGWKPCGSLLDAFIDAKRERQQGVEAK